jgi:hypothetical protein
VKDENYELLADSHSILNRPSEKLKQIFKKEHERSWALFIWLRKGQVGSCESGYKTLVS